MLAFEITHQSCIEIVFLNVILQHVQFQCVFIKYVILGLVGILRRLEYELLLVHISLQFPTNLLSQHL